MRWIFHLGYPKCASTSIQKALPDVPGIYYAGKDSARFAGTNGREIVRKVLALTSPAFAPRDTVRRWKQEVEAEAAARGVDIIILSDEDFLSTHTVPRKPDEIVATIRHFFGEQTQFLIIIRNPADFLVSHFKQKVRTGYPFDFAHYCTDILDNQYASILGQLDYHSLFKALSRRGADFSVVCFEEIVSSPGHLAACFRNMGIDGFPEQLPDENVSTSDEVTGWILEENFRDYISGKMALAHPHRFDVLHHVDRVHLSKNTVISRTFPVWWDSISAANKKRQQRLKLPGGTAKLDLDIPDKTVRELDRLFRKFCNNLEEFLPHADLEAFGYPV